MSQQVKVWRTLELLQGADLKAYTDLGSTQKCDFDGATGTWDFKGSVLKNIKMILRKQAVTGVAPSATAATYGTATDIEPTSGYHGIVPTHLAATAGGTFGTETLTVRITATYSDGTTANITKDFTAAGTTNLTNAEIYGLIKDAVSITKFSVDCKSSISSSTATGGANLAGLNT
jgi:hypothetical protein